MKKRFKKGTKLKERGRLKERWNEKERKGMSKMRDRKKGGKE